MNDCGCSFEARDAKQRKVLSRLLAINGGMAVVEVIVELLAHSIGAMADALDMLADALVYGTGLYAIGRPMTVKNGAAYWSGISRVVLASGLLVEVVRPAIYGSEPNSMLMMTVSVVALVANVYCLSLFDKHRDGEVHVRASWIFLVAPQSPTLESLSPACWSRSRARAGLI